MAKYRLHIYFVIIMALYFVIRLIRPEVDNTFVKYHLTDILFVPAMGIFALIGVRTIKQDATINISIWMIAVLVLFSIVYFEWYLPSTAHPIGWYVSDSIDSLMYIIGGIIFYLLQRLSSIRSIR